MQQPRRAKEGVNTAAEERKLGVNAATEEREQGVNIQNWGMGPGNETSLVPNVSLPPAVTTALPVNR